MKILQVLATKSDRAPQLSDKHLNNRVGQLKINVSLRCHLCKSISSSSVLT